MPDPARPGPRKVLGGRYELRRRIAEGPVTEVWKAWDRVQRRDVAVKSVRAELRSDTTLARRFRREVTATIPLNHPNVVKTYEVLAEGTGVFMVMELVDGSTLRQVLEGTRVLGPGRAVALATQVATALDHAHGKDVIHRNVKPENVLVDLDDEVKVADFGISRAFERPEDAGRDMIETARVVGTAPYLSPERIKGLGVDERSDLYGLGVVLYEMLCGNPPFTGTNPMAIALQHVTTPPTRPRLVQSGIPKPLEEIVLRCLAKAPEDRYSSAAELAAALGELDLGPDDAVALVVRDPTPPRGIRRTPPGPGRPVLPPVGASPRRIAPPRPVPGSGPAVSGPAGPPGPRGPAGPGPTGSGGSWQPRTDPQPVRSSMYGGAEYWAPRPPEPPPRKRRSWLGPLIVVVVVIIVLAVAGVLLSTTQVGRDLIEEFFGDDAVEGEALPQTFTSFDPPPGNGSENDSELPNLIDGNPRTSWVTSNYPPGNGLGGVKPGVGLVWQTDAEVAFELVSLDSPDRGWTFEIYISSRRWQTLTGWGAPASDPVTSEGGTVQVDLDGSRGRTLLVWITSVGPRGQVELTEVQVLTDA